MKPTYRLSELVSVILPASAATMLVAGVLLWRGEWISPDLVPLLKSLCLVAFAILGAAAVAAASCMAGHAQAALVHGKRFRSVYGPALLFGAGYAMAGAIGVHIGWEVLTKPTLAAMSLPPGSVVVAASLFLALGKPVFSFVLEGRKQVDRFAEAQADREVREEAAKSEERSERRLSLVRGLGALGAATALAGAGFAVPAPVQAATLESAPTPAPNGLDEADYFDDGIVVPPGRVALIQAAPHWVKAHLREKFVAFNNRLADGSTVLQAARANGLAASTGFHWAKRILEAQSTPLSA